LSDHDGLNPRSILAVLEDAMGRGRHGPGLLLLFAGIYGKYKLR
jgi:hypothetical protein